MKGDPVTLEVDAFLLRPATSRWALFFYLCALTSSANFSIWVKSLFQVVYMTPVTPLTVSALVSQSLIF